MKILLTGFKPYDGEHTNASEELIHVLQKVLPAEQSIWVPSDAILPVQAQQLADQLPALLQSVQPDMVLMFGQAPGRAHINLETVARNDFRGRPIQPDGPAMRHATLPGQQAMVDALKAAGIPADLSKDAGDYFCNMALYLALAYATQVDSKTFAGFVHLPILPSQADAHPPGTPVLALTHTMRAAELIAAQLCDNAACT